MKRIPWLTLADYILFVMFVSLFLIIADYIGTRW
jgi:hypothetical protein